tara:strand:- start:1002 stop:1499 length:498 start_codon:yes stop_codon:yes gene_type:complete
MSDNLKRIYLVEEYKNRRHAHPESVCYFLYPEHTKWAEGHECDCSRCEYVIIKTKLVSASSSDFHKAEENSEKYIAENPDEALPRGYGNQGTGEWILKSESDKKIEDLKRRHMVDEHCSESFRMKLFTDKKELKSKFNDIIKLIKMCNTPEQIKQLQELDYLSEM